MSKNKEQDAEPGAAIGPGAWRKIPQLCYQSCLLALSPCLPALAYADDPELKHFSGSTVTLTDEYINMHPNWEEKLEKEYGDIR